MRPRLGESNSGWQDFVGARKLLHFDSDDEIERWQNQLHEVTMLNCNMMVRSLRCVTTEARELRTYDGLTAVDEFLNKFESAVLGKQWFDALKWALCATPMQW